MRFRWFFSAVLLSLALPVLGQTERWYVVKVLGERAGWARMSETVRGDRVTTESEMVMALARATDAIEVATSTTFTETSSGRPISWSVSQTFGGSKASRSATFPDPQTMLLSNGMTTPKDAPTSIPLGDAPWLPPAAARRQLKEAIANRQTDHSVLTLDPTAGTSLATLSYQGFEPATVAAWGASIPSIRVEVVSSQFPSAPSVEYVTEQGHLIRSVTSVGEIEVEFLLADRDLAMSVVDPPEIMQATFIQPDKSIRSPRKATNASFRVRSANAPLPDLPQDASQRTTRESDRVFRVTVDSGRTTPATEAERSEALLQSAMLDREDPVILRLRDQARPDAGSSDALRAEAMRRFVYQHISEKSLGVGFASASDVARSQTGDCTEHAVLLAALLRADGIPARVVSGLVYADSFVGSRDIFGYHMWTQAAIETEPGLWVWTDLDATLSMSTPFDATHIALDVSLLNDITGNNAMLALAPLLGTLSIEVLEVRHP